ncbi:hypothetical protein Dimus_015866 [Dionaea muscipula]
MKRGGSSEVVPPSKDQLLVEPTAKDDVDGSSGTSISSIQVSEAWRCMSLYFALCTKKHSLLRQIFVIYSSSSESVKQVIHQHLPILIRTIGASSSLLEIVSDPPDGSHDLLMQVLHLLIGGGIPSPVLILIIKKLYAAKGKDIEILFPILPFLSKEEVLLAFPRLVSLSAEKFQVAVARLLEIQDHISLKQRIVVGTPSTLYGHQSSQAIPMGTKIEINLNLMSRVLVPASDLFLFRSLIPLAKSFVSLMV